MSQLWYPYTQMLNAPEMPCVVNAQGPYLEFADGRRVLDATASWWCLIHGYKHPELDQALQEQAARFAHVMLGGLTHAPAQALARALVEITPEPLNHVFFSDSGSVGVEVALKMAVQYWHNRGQANKQRILAFYKSYHGDTSGCMAVCDPAEGMHHLFSHLLPQQIFAPAPSVGLDASWQQVQEDIQPVRLLLQQHAHETAAVIIEPLLQAAGGFNMYSPLYLQALRALCDEFEVLLILDEVATGFGRTGTCFALDQAHICPDILVLGKGLTGGYLGHAATLAQTHVYEAFLSQDSERAFMHGPTFMGNPLATAVALRSLQVFQQDQYLQRIQNLQQQLQQELCAPLAHEQVVDIRAFGATGVIEVKDAQALAGVQAYALQEGVWLRSFDRYLYTMPAYILTPEQMRHIIQVMRAWFE